MSLFTVTVEMSPLKPDITLQKQVWQFSYHVMFLREQIITSVFQTMKVVTLQEGYSDMNSCNGEVRPT